MISLFKTNGKSSKIILEGIQIKSTEKAKKLAEALSVIEIECGIHSVEIIVRNSFICNDVNLKELNTTSSEIALVNALINK